MLCYLSFDININKYIEEKFHIQVSEENLNTTPRIFFVELPIPETSVQNPEINEEHVNSDKFGDIDPKIIIISSRDLNKSEIKVLEKRLKIEANA